MQAGFGARRSLTAPWLLVLLYAWAFPLLGFIHQDVSHHARVPACSGFAQEHNHPNADGGPLVTNLHVESGHSPCAVCALTRSLTLAHETTIGPRPPVPSITPLALPDVPTAGHTCFGPLGSRAPPAA